MLPAYLLDFIFAPIREMITAQRAELPEYRLSLPMPSHWA